MRTCIVCTILVFCCLLIGCGLEKYISVRHNLAVSDSMSPTIKPGDHFASIGVKDNDIDPIKRFDIVVYKPQPSKFNRKFDDNVRLVHRVIGLGNEKLEIRKGIVFINEVELNLPFEIYPSQDNFGPITIPESEYFILGDNRPNSEDSRFWKKATISREDIDGKVNNIIRKEDYDNGKRW